MSRRKFPWGLRHPNPSPSHPVLSHPNSSSGPTAVPGAVKALGEAVGQVSFFLRASQGFSQSPSPGQQLRLASPLL